MLPSTKNKAFLSAYGKGWDAAENGYSPDSCPYTDHRTKSGAITFSRAFMKYWIMGYEGFLTSTASLSEVASDSPPSSTTPITPD